MIPVPGGRRRAPAWLVGSRGSGMLGGLLGAGEWGVGGEQTGGLAQGGDLETAAGVWGGHPSGVPPPSPGPSVGVPALEQAVGIESRPNLSPSHRLGGPRTSGEKAGKVFLLLLQGWLFPSSSPPGETLGLCRSVPWMQKSPPFSGVWSPGSWHLPPRSQLDSTAPCRQVHGLGGQ